MTTREFIEYLQDLDALAEDMIAMLRDLESGYGWDELHVRFDEVQAEAKRLGIGN